MTIGFRKTRGDIEKRVIASEAKQSMSRKALLILDCHTRFAASQ
jgi:hypothetical protein